MSLVRSACASVLFACAGAACAANKTWIGTDVIGSWSSPANWQGGGVPQPGDHLSFPTQVQTGNDMGPLTLDGIDVGATVTLGGGALTFTNRNPIAMSNPSAILGIDNDVIFAADTTIALTAKSVVFNGKVTLSGGTFRILAPTTGIRFNSLQVVETIPTSIDVQADSWLSTSSISATGDFAFTGANFDGYSMNLGVGITPARIQAPNITIGANNPTRPMDIVTPAGATTRLSFGGGLAGFPVAINLEGGTVILRSSLDMYGTLGGDAHLVIDTFAYLGLYNRATLTGGITVTPQGTLKSGNSFSLPAVGPIVVQGRFDIDYSDELVESFQCDGGSYFGHSGNPLHVSGPVVLNNCAFNLYENYDPVPPGGVTLISSDGSSPVTGTFASLPEGAPLSLSPDRSYTIYRISYRGGDGNDVVALWPTTPGAVSSKRNLRFESPSYSATTREVIQVAVLVTSAGGAPVAGEAIDVRATCLSVYGACPFVNAGVVDTDASGRAVFTIQGGITGGQVMLSATDKTNSSSLPAMVPMGITGRYQDMWWTASENGWGLTVIQHGERLFCVLFVYDASGQPTWLVVPSGTWDVTHTTWTGEAYTPKGSPFHAYQAQALAVGVVQGTMNIRFFTPDTTLLEYISTDGARTNKTLTREPFGPPGGKVVGGRGDMWWGGASQNGWGIAVMEQAPIIFPIWYTYDASGTARWYVVPVGSFTSPNVFEGRVYKTTSSPWFVLAYDPTKLHSSDVGSFKLNFNGDSAALDYNVEGHSGSVPLVKEPF